jgi:hypothetical protein
MSRRHACQFVAPLALLATIAAGPAFADALTVPIDHSVRVTVAGPAASVLVGNPAVADVTVVDSHTVFVLGRGYGQTDVVILNRDGQTIYSGEVTVAAVGGGRVSVYRGPARTDMACAPGCEVSVRSPGAGGASSPAATPAPAGGGPLAAVATALPIH